MDKLTSKDLAVYRLNSARERLTVAETLYGMGYYLDAVSKAYYAVFQAARAALATLEMDSRKHSGVIGLFNLHFIKTGLLPKELRKIIVSAQDLRLASDYNDFYVVGREDAGDSIENAKRFISSVEVFLKSRGFIDR